MKIYEFRMGDVEDPHLYAKLEILNFKNKNKIIGEVTYNLVQESGVWRVDVFDESEDPLNELKSLGEMFRKDLDKFEHDSETYWKSLSYDEQLKVFCAVSKRIFEGEIKQNGSYRYVLYNVFNFATDAYAVAQNAGYLAIHNAIFDGQRLREHLKDFCQNHMNITNDNLDLELDNYIKKLYF